MYLNILLFILLFKYLNKDRARCLPPNFKLCPPAPTICILNVFMNISLSSGQIEEYDVDDMFLEIKATESQLLD